MPWKRLGMPPLLHPPVVKHHTPPSMGRNETCLPRHPAIIWHLFDNERRGHEPVSSHTPKNGPPPRVGGGWGGGSDTHPPRISRLHPPTHPPNPRPVGQPLRTSRGWMEGNSRAGEPFRPQQCKTLRAWSSAQQSFPGGRCAWTMASAARLCKDVSTDPIELSAIANNWSVVSGGQLTHKKFTNLCKYMTRVASKTTLSAERESVLFQTSRGHSEPANAEQIRTFFFRVFSTCCPMHQNGVP